jgi:hypothetical protein
LPISVSFESVNETSVAVAVSGTNPYFYAASSTPKNP